MIPATEYRVPEHTSARSNERILDAARQRVFARAAQPARIERDLARLDEEWDVERTLETNASALAFVGTMLGAFVHPYFLAIPALVTAFLFQHAVQGWCPPLPILRALGFRTAKEILDERTALKALRGDFVGCEGDPNASLGAARR